MFVCPCVLSILSLSLAAPGSTNSPQSKEREESRTNKVGLSIEKLFLFSVARHKSCCPLLLSLYKWVSAKNKKESGKKKTKKIVIISDVNIFIVQAYSVHIFLHEVVAAPVIGLCDSKNISAHFRVVVATQRGSGP